MRSKRAVPLLLGMLLGMLLGGCGAPGVAYRAPSPTVVVLVADCNWAHRAHTWLDSDGDGRRGPAEPPLAGFTLLVDDVANRFVAVGSPAMTDAAGTASLFVALPGCPRAEFEVYAMPPPGYRATTPLRVRQRGDEAFEFGFAEQR